MIPQLSKTQWREDLRFFAQELTRRHKNAYHRVTPDVFQQAVARLEGHLPALQDFEVVVGLQRLAAMIGDGHTRLGTQGFYHLFPLQAFWFGSELRIVRASRAYRQALGTRLVKIGRFSTGAVQKRIRVIIPQGENRWFQMNQSVEQIVCLEPLAALGILPEPAESSLTFQDDAGKRFFLPVAPVTPNTGIDWEEAVIEPPLFARKRNEPFWFTELAGSRAVYLCFRGYQDLEQNAKEFWSFVDQHSPERLIIDMRQNGGGNYTLGREHLLYPVQFRRSINNREHLFVIAGRGTFSAAMTNVIDFHRETDAIIVGEPTGARPNGYQEVDQFTLPNSRLPVFCSIFYYRFQERDTAAFYPDQRIDPDWTAYKEGLDPVLEWILAQP